MGDPEDQPLAFAADDVQCRAEAAAIELEDYGNPASSMEICGASGELFVRQAHEARINAEFPLFLAELYHRAMTAGFAREKLASIVKVLRRDI